MTACPSTSPSPLDARAAVCGLMLTEVRCRGSKGADVIILGVILLVLGFLLNLQLLYILGAILAIVGVVLFVLGSTGRAVGGRRHYF
jgi:Family of unknown function (DUF6131)